MITKIDALNIETGLPVKLTNFQKLDVAGRLMAEVEADLGNKCLITLMVDDAELSDHYLSKSERLGVIIDALSEEIQEYMPAAEREAFSEDDTDDSQFIQDMVENFSRGVYSDSDPV